MFKQRLQFYLSLLVLSDALIIAASWIVSYLLRFEFPFIPVSKGVPPLTLYFWFLLLIVPVWLIAFYFSGLYKVTPRNRTQLVLTLGRAVVIAFLILIAVTYFTHRQSLSRAVLGYFVVISTIALSVSRLWLRERFINSRHPAFKTRALVIGAGELGRLIAERINSRPEAGVEVIGFISLNNRNGRTSVSGLPIWGGLESAKSLIEKEGVGLVLIALPLEHQERLGEALDALADSLAEIKVVPDLCRFMSLHGSVEEFDGLPIVSLTGSPMHGWNRVLKRALDIVIASVAIIPCSPIMGLAALVVKLTSPGPLLYRQQRMGLDGRIFNMAKFRTMRADAESETGPVWASADDPRRTPVGRFLRRFSIDELPQIFQVLKGEMSLVGPRPERPELIAEFKSQIPRYMLRHKMKAGMTGWAQVNGFRGDTSLKGRIEHDLDYIENWSLAFDFKILARTTWRVLFDKNAY